MTMASRKRKNTQDVEEEEPVTKIKKNLTKTEKTKKSKKGASGFQKKDNASKKKPNWTEFKKKKKELRKTRKEQKCSVFDLTEKSKKLWERVRRNDCPAEQRQKLTAEIHKLLKNNLQKVVYSHDLSRVVQWLLKIGTPDIRAEVIEELTPHMPVMLQSKYACFCVNRMLKYGSHDSRKAIVRSLHGHVVKLASHSVAAPILENIYSTWTSAVEKSQLRLEFYGDMYKQDKEQDIHCLDDIFKKTPAMRDATLSAVKANMSRILDKKLTNSSLFQTVLCEYLKHCSKEDREEVLQQIQNSILDFKSSKDGAHVAVMCIWHSSNKVKKQITKSLKGHMVEVATSEYGHLILLALFDTVDDTVLLKKTLMPELLGDLLSIASNEYGRKVILYLVAHRDPMYFHPAEVEMLKNGATLSNSKKDEGVRTSELLDSVSDPLLESITGDTSSWISNSSIGMVTLAVLKSGKGRHLLKCYEAIADYVTDVTKRIEESGKEYLPVEHSGIHMLLKKLIHHDKERNGPEHETFSFVLASRLTESILESWIPYNRGCFLLVALLESTIDSAVIETRNKVELLENTIKEQKFVGAQILLKKIDHKSDKKDEHKMVGVDRS
ncbi:protein penguin [Periplaneta americana]|uniref:protein penguin n=1 Tax=Periplaneta americana TaxID=6978 RepID=UPI0037E90359